MIAKMEELGLSFYNADGQMKSLSEMVSMLQTNMGGLTDEQKQNALVTLFGPGSPFRHDGFNGSRAGADRCADRFLPEL